MGISVTTCTIGTAHALIDNPKVTGIDECQVLERAKRFLVVLGSCTRSLSIPASVRRLKYAAGLESDVRLIVKVFPESSGGGGT